MDPPVKPENDVICGHSCPMTPKLNAIAVKPENDDLGKAAKESSEWRVQFRHPTA